MEVVSLVKIMIECGHSQHLTRERSLRAFCEQFEQTKDSLGEEVTLDAIYQVLRLMFKSREWESRYGAINISVKALDMTQLAPDSEIFQQFKTFLFEKCQILFIDEEFRVRNNVGDIMKKLIKVDGSKIYDEFKDLLFTNIRDTFNRDPKGSDASSNPNIEEKKESLPNSQKIITEKHPSLWDKQTDDMHDTEGWKSLETSMRLLQKMIEALGTDFLIFDFKEVTELLLKAANHLNRFVREISYFVVESLYKISEKCDEENKKRFIELCSDLIPVTSQGLADNWSQVRFASCCAARAYYSFAKTNDFLRQEYDKVLIPRLCLNRYYVAEGVRNYSIETWRQVAEEKGIELVIDNVEYICQFYISQCLADNHAVREAACHCISELCTKVANVDPEPFRPYIDDLLGALIDCFKDQSWPVRDSACISCGKFVQRFPEESSNRKEELFALWIAHLSDNIASVREHSAMALMDAMDAYEDEIVELIKSEIKENLMKAKNDQQKESTKHSGLSNTSTFGVVRPIDNEEEKHADQQLFSCGSLAPKLKRGGGCMDHGFTRDKEPWEHSDGCIYLVRELSRTKRAALVANYLDSLSELGFVDHFKHSAHLKENLFKSIKTIMHNLKKKFRPFLEMFLDPLFRNIKHQNRNCAAAAEDCLFAMESQFGKNIFKAILESENPSFAEEFARIKGDFHPPV
ncbi:unnamed protein product [Moneuplotes crassus]|uniref:Uncharacterized protein n=3 Tax=Euplotes crassus TaxID=5936 RepID=A0AAD1TZS0_EUPCR|nr:unnamed protein product [Moneuplotes crassus]